MTAPPVLDDKMRAMLMKLRKGADASVSLPQLLKVLTLLGGWRVEEIVGLVPLHYEKSEGHGLMKYGLWRNDEIGARSVYDTLKKLQVDRLPSNPKLGQVFVTELDPFRMQDQGYRKAYGAQYKLWVASPGYRVTDPQGRVFEVLPNRHDVNSGKSLGEQDQGLPVVDAKHLKKRLVTYDILPWLKKETPYLDQINDLLGTEAHQPAAPRTRENTGTCGACFHNYKLEHGGGAKLPRIVLHGYKRPGWGHVVGRCSGEDLPPYELSPEATKAELGQLRAMYKSTAEYLARVKAGAITEFSPFFGSPVVRKSELPASVWDLELRNHEKRLTNELNELEDTMRVYEWLVKHWEKRPLPDPGVPEFNWLGHAARQIRKHAG